MTLQFVYTFTMVTMQFFFVWLIILLSMATAHRSLRAPSARQLQADMVAVELGTVAGQSVSFHTGPGVGNHPNIKLEVGDVCRRDSSHRVELGYLYPDNNVQGIKATNPGPILPGDHAGISFDFVEGIESNTDIFTSIDESHAQVEFCLQIGLYADDALVNFQEVKLTYNVNLVTKVGTYLGP